MNQAVFSFSPDGGSTVFAFSPSGKTLLWVLVAAGLALVGLALALIGAGYVVLSLLHFFLTASGDSLLRILAFFVALLMPVLVLKLFRRTFHPSGKVV